MARYKGAIMEYYWELILKDGEEIEIPPLAVEVVQRRLGNKDTINLKTRSIPFSEIKIFQQTSKPYGEQPLLDAAAQAFKDPIYVETVSPLGRKEEAIKGQFVKKKVTRREFNKYYAKLPSYRKLEDNGNFIEVAWLMPVHEIDVSKMNYCTPDEVELLTKQ